MKKRIDFEGNKYNRMAISCNQCGSSRAIGLVKRLGQSSRKELKQKSCCYLSDLFDLVLHPSNINGHIRMGTRL